MWPTSGNSFSSTSDHVFNRIADRPSECVAHGTAGVMRFVAIAALAVAGLAVSAAAPAQSMYRCGSTYQDRPCENGQPGKIIGTVPKAADKAPMDLACVRRGEETKKIIWAREGGALRDHLIAEANTGERKKLIADVYAIRANSGEVRAAIENECMAEKSRAQQGGYASEDEMSNRERYAGKKIGNGAGDKNQSGSDRSAENANNANAQQEQKRAQCDLLSGKLASSRRQQNAGGSGATMDNLNRQQRETENALSMLDCNGKKNNVSMQ
ncbi:hypothetical protein BH11PSE12_BH11PSE12_20170 [soil metagenome]